MFAALGGITVLSFVIALAAKSCGGGPAPKIDAAPRLAIVVLDAAVDATPIDAAAVLDPTHIEIDPDATTAGLADASVPDDAREPTIRP